MTEELNSLLALPVSSLCCVCRLCATVIDASSAVNLFITDIKEENLAKRINKYLPVAVNESDPFPKTACKHCADQVNKFHDLAEKCVNFQEHLHKTLEPNPAFEIDAKAELDVELEGLKDSPDVEFDFQELDYLERRFLSSGTRDNNNSSSTGPPCQVCNELLPSFQQCLQHQKTHVNHGLCVICNFKNDSQVEINIHLRKHFADNLHESLKSVKYVEHGTPKSCKKCSKEFSSIGAAVEHCRTHRPTDISSFNCIMCLQSVTDELLHTHVETHFQEAEESCEDCQKVFTSERTLRLHRCSVTRKHKCSQCKMSFKSESRLRFHESFHTNKTTFCTICRKDFKFESRIFLHLASVHQGLRDNPFCCDVCGKTFRWMTALREHQRTHGEDRPFACGKCDARFHSKSSLTAHLPSHDDTARLHCLRCDYSTNRKQNLVKHVARLHQQVEPSQSVVRCSECLEIFPNAEHVDVEGHSHAHDGGASLELFSVSKLFQCERCHSSFRTADELAMHRSRHSTKEKFLCRLCSADFGKHDFLVRHQKNVHREILSQYTGKFTVQMVFICDICQLEWTDYSQLLNHKERGNCLQRKLKGEIRTSKVPTGPRLLPLKASQLKINKEGLFECPDCQRTYKSRRRYRLHLATHSERKTAMG